MGLGVLGSRRRKRPGLAGKVKLVPAQLRDFFAALAGQGLEFDDAAIGPIHLVGGPKDTEKLIISALTNSLTSRLPIS